MRIEPFEYLRPATLNEAAEALAKNPGVTCILAGGSDLIPRMKQQIIRPAYILDMTDVAELRYIRGDRHGLSIGAGTTLHDIATSEVVRRQAPLLAVAAAKAASQQIRNVATLGGNICQETRCWYFNQSLAWKRAKPNCFKAGGRICHVVNKPGQCYAAYQGDTVPALLALNARVRLVAINSDRTIPFEQLYSGKGEAPLTLLPGELVAEVGIPDLPAGSGTAYLKFSHRKAVDFPLAGVAVWLSIDGSTGQVTGARLALSAVGSAPFLVPKVEEILMGREINATTAAEASEAAASAARPVHNLHHGPTALRRAMVGILSRLAIEEAGSKTLRVPK